MSHSYGLPDAMDGDDLRRNGVSVTKGIYHKTIVVQTDLVHPNSLNVVTPAQTSGAASAGSISSGTLMTDSERIVAYSAYPPSLLIPRHHDCFFRISNFCV